MTLLVLNLQDTKQEMIVNLYYEVWMSLQVLMQKQLVVHCLFLRVCTEGCQHLYFIPIAISRLF